MIYGSAIFYEFCMRLLYGRGFEDKYRPVAEEIPEGAQVLDVCCGDCRIYRKYLQKKRVRYRGLDRSRAFERYASRKQIPFELWDQSRGEIPKSDYILILSSLYQFYPRREEILGKLLKSARRKLIITEPIVNLAQSRIPLLSRLSRRVSGSHERFDEKSLRSLIEPHAAWVEKVKTIANGREMLVVFNTQGKREGLR